MKCKLQSIWRKNFAPKFEGREGLHAIAFLGYLILVELAGTGVWFYLSTILVSFDKFLLLHRVLTPDQALGTAIVVVVGLGALIYGLLLGTRKGNRFMIAIATAIDKLVIKILFHVKFFFVSANYIIYTEPNFLFRTRTPSLPDMPPRHHLA